MAKYGGLDLYDKDMKKRNIIDSEDIHYVNKEGISLIVIADEPSTDHDYASGHEYLFNNILTRNHNPGVILETTIQDIYSQTNK